MANPFPFVAGSVLTAAELNGIGEAAVSFTPTFTNYTRGNGTSIAYYMRVNKLVYVYVKETLGSTQMARARIDDTGAQVYWGTTFSGTSTVILFADNSSGTYTTFANTSATVPMTWASTDAFQFAFVYEVA
jgi:hypothetical protein